MAVTGCTGPFGAGAAACGPGDAAGWAHGALASSRQRGDRPLQRPKNTRSFTAAKCSRRALLHGQGRPGRTLSATCLGGSRVAFFGVAQHLGSGHTWKGPGRGKEAAGNVPVDPPPLILTVSDGWFVAAVTADGPGVEVRHRAGAAGVPVRTTVSLREARAAAAELAAAWPRLRKVRRHHWQGVRITDCGRFVRLTVDDTGAAAEVWGIALRSREEIHAAADWLEAWARWAERPVTAAQPVPGRRIPV